jgi:hypothetical protein
VYQPAGLGTNAAACSAMPAFARSGRPWPLPFDGWQHCVIGGMKTSWLDRKAWNAANYAHLVV